MAICIENGASCLGSRDPVVPPLGTAWNHRKHTNRPYPGDVASRLSIINFVAMVMPINMTILLLQITQISNMKVIGFMVDF